jgi:hypothetical protein
MKCISALIIVTVKIENCACIDAINNLQNECTTGGINKNLTQKVWLDKVSL